MGAALGVLGLILDPLYSMLPLTRAIGEVTWSANNEFLLVAIPLFIMLGEVLLRAGFAERMYAAMSLWLSWLPGGLMHANIGALHAVLRHIRLQRGHRRQRWAR